MRWQFGLAGRNKHRNTEVSAGVHAEKAVLLVGTERLYVEYGA